MTFEGHAIKVIENVTVPYSAYDFPIALFCTVSHLLVANREIYIPRLYDPVGISQRRLVLEN